MGALITREFKRSTFAGNYGSRLALWDMQSLHNDTENADNAFNFKGFLSYSPTSGKKYYLKKNPELKPLFWIWKSTSFATNQKTVFVIVH